MNAPETLQGAISATHADRLASYFTRSRSTRQSAECALQPAIWKFDVCALNVFRAVMRPIERMQSWLKRSR